MSEHIEMTDLKKQYEAWAVIAEELLAEREKKLKEVEELYKTTR